MSAKINKNVILVFDDPQAWTSTHELITSLRSTFEEMTVIKSDARRFVGALTVNPRVKIAVLPGIAGEVSRIPELIGKPHDMERLGNYVDRGGVLMAFCASACSLLAETHWAPYWAPARHRINPKPLFNGVAHCPVGRTRPNIKAGIDCVVKPVDYLDARGDWLSGAAPYGNGPSLDPATTKGLEPLAYYRSGGKIAEAWITRGRGGILWSGILPYLDHEPAMREGNLSPKLETLVAELEEHKTERREIWHVATDRVRRHLKLPSLPSPAASNMQSVAAMS